MDKVTLAAEFEEKMTRSDQARRPGFDVCVESRRVGRGTVRNKFEAAVTKISHVDERFRAKRRQEDSSTHLTDDIAKCMLTNQPVLRTHKTNISQS